MRPKIVHPVEVQAPARTRPYTRQRLTLIALLALAAAGVALNLFVAGPFIPGLTWGLAFAVVTNPIHQWIRSRVAKPGLAAGISVFVVTMALIIPAGFLAWQVGSQAGDIAVKIQDSLQSGSWERRLETHPRLAGAWRRVERTIDVRHEAQVLAESVQQSAIGWMRTAVWGTVQVLIALFALFYFFRDQDSVMRALRSLMPMSNKESDYFFQRIRDMTHASIYGTLVVAGVQGSLGGFMFWILGIPNALLWGVSMGLLAIIPVAGAFVIWAPTAVFLATQGDWTKAIILAAWGTVVVGLIDNLLYPVLVSSQMRIHTLPVFISIIGGLLVFGAAGIVLGPIVLSGTIALLDILRRRTMHGRSAEEQT